MEQVVVELEQKVQQLERDGMCKQQQQEELTSMCAQVGPIAATDTVLCRTRRSCAGLPAIDTCVCGVGIGV
jgi:hypothetical protein